MAEKEARQRAHDDAPPRGKREKRRYRGASGMVWRFLLALAVISGVRIVIDLKIFFTMPSQYTVILMIVPTLLCAVFCLNLSIPERAFRKSSYVLMFILLIPVVFFCDAMRTRIHEFFYSIIRNYDLLSWQTLFLNAVLGLLLNALVMVSFVVVWRAAFTGGLRMRMRWWSLLNPVLWIVSYLGCLLVSYCTILLSVMNQSDPYALALFGAAQEIPKWYDITALGNLFVEYAQQPIAVFSLGFMLLWAMLMLRRSYMQSLVSEPPPPPPKKPEYMEGLPSLSGKESARPADSGGAKPASPRLSSKDPTTPKPPQQAFPAQGQPPQEGRGPQRPL